LFVTMQSTANYIPQIKRQPVAITLDYRYHICRCIIRSMSSQDVLYFTLTGLSIIVFLLLSYLIIRAYIKVEYYEDKILKKKEAMDNIEHDAESKRRLDSGWVNQSQFERLTEKRRKPMEKELETLKMKRQFILDKIPLISFFKR
jgi:hypothetical protein